MGKDTEHTLTAGHRALNEAINKRFDGNKRKAGQVADKTGFPARGEGEQRTDLIVQTITKLSLGYVKRPSLERIVWFNRHWKIPMARWTED